MNYYLLQHMLKKSCDTYPLKIGIISDGFEFTYDEIFKDAILFSKYLHQNNIKRQDRVLIQSGNSYVTIIAYWAILMCDAVACVIDHAIDVNQLDYVISDLDPTMCIASNISELQHDIYKKYAHKIQKLFFIHQHDFIEFLRKNENLIFEDLYYWVNTEQNLAMIIYTSGSTGNPKGVMLSHRNIIAAVHSISSYLAIAADDRIISFLPMHFDYGFYQMLLSLLNGATFVLEKNLFNSTKALSLIQKYQATIVPCLPTITNILNLCFQCFGGNYDSVLKITNTGETMTAKQVAQLLNIFPNAKIYSMFGLTECKRCSYVPPDQLFKKIQSVGIPIPNIEMWIEDEHQNKCLPNTIGELVISGPTVMLGYWNNSLETQKKIYNGKNGARQLRTGDFMIQDEDGYFYFKGRRDHVIKFKGIKFNPSIYEKIVSEMDEINRCYLFVSTIDSNSNRLFVCLETEFEATLSNQFQLKIRKLFPSSQQPDYVYSINQFPNLSNGKLNKILLQKLAKEYFLKEKDNVH
ncbi:MAG: hypothetical protein ACD_29C00053G0004 [uncultured bacterium]|nr:MAG: hypothetical protein ACD_29C00053G0004 [uncultured bacterium]